MRKSIERQMEKSLPTFMERASEVPWQARGILLSEAFAFCAIGDLFDIDIILESGIWLGRSTEIFAKYFAPKPIMAFDINLKKTTVDRLEKYDNLVLKQGEGPANIHHVLKNKRIQRAGIFIDGPKESRAALCAKDCLSHKNVSFVGVHDAWKAKVKRMLQNLGYPLFFTDEAWFLRGYSKLDKGESQWDEEQGKKWVPYHVLEKTGKSVRNLGSYGHTVGVALRSRKF